MLIDESKIGTDEYIFSLPSNPTINKYLRIWGKENNILTDITFSISRNTFAQLLSKNSNIKLLSSLMGHTNWSTTQGYVHTDFDEKLSSLTKMQEMLQDDECTSCS
jgi:site-specific recombinase XerC